MNDPMAELVDRLAVMDARVRMLEGGTRVGLGGLRSAWETAAADPLTFGAYYSGPAAATWLDDEGNTGTGYPSLTIVDCPARYMIFWSLRLSNIATNAVSSYRTREGEVTVAINGVDTPSLPNARRAFSNLNTGTTSLAMSMIVARRDTPGTKTFQMRGYFFDTFPAGTIQPQFTDIYLGVLPLSVA